MNSVELNQGGVNAIAVPTKHEAVNVSVTDFTYTQFDGVTLKPFKLKCAASTKLMVTLWGENHATVGEAVLTPFHEGLNVELIRKVWASASNGAVNGSVAGDIVAETV